MNPTRSCRFWLILAIRAAHSGATAAKNDPSKQDITKVKPILLPLSELSSDLDHIKRQIGINCSNRGLGRMDSGSLLERLIEIERAIGVKDSIALRRMVVDTQDYVLQMQKEYAEFLRPKQGPNRTQS